MMNAQDLSQYNHLLSPQRRLMRAREQFEVNLRHARELNLDIDGMSIFDVSGAMSANRRTRSPSKGFNNNQNTLDSLSPTRRSPSPRRRPESPSKAASSPVASPRGAASPRSSATPFGFKHTPLDVDDHTAVIVSLQSEVERLEAELEEERAEKEHILQGSNGGNGEGLTERCQRLENENADLRGKLLKATRALGRLRQRKKDLEYM